MELIEEVILLRLGQVCLVGALRVEEAFYLWDSNSKEDIFFNSRAESSI